MVTNAHATSPFAAGLACRCPRCGHDRLFASRLGLDVKPVCGNCGLDLRQYDTGDGPAVFAILILGFVILGAALLVEFNMHPPLWLHMLIWGPVTLAVALGLLRPLKALMIALHYHNKAGEGRRGEE